MASAEEEPDQFPGALHPRVQKSLFGLEAAERAFLDAYRSGRLHHAWLIGGMQGIGKATFAYRAARFLLSHPDPQSEAVRVAQTLADGIDAGVAAKVAALSHPNLTVLRRTPATEKKAASTIISVDAVRRALAMFSATPGSDGYRICIVDSVEDLNISSSNALLKVIEEPPLQSLFLLVSHAPGRTLPTIRSRCRQLLLRKLADADVAKAVRTLPPPFGDAEVSVLESAAHLAKGSVREALSLMDEKTIALIKHVHGMLDQLPSSDPAQVHALADSLTGRDADAHFSLFLSTVYRWISEQIHNHAHEGTARLAGFVEVWEKIAQIARETQILNLDRRPLIFTLFSALAEASRSTQAA